MNSAGAVFMTIPTHVDVQNGAAVPEDPLASWKGSLQQIIDNCDIVIVNSAENTPITKGLVEMAVNKPVVIVKGSALFPLQPPADPTLWVRKSERSTTIKKTTKEMNQG
jgi:hypothetical protein